MPEGGPRRIAHLDMDAFFASVSLLRYPEIRDEPVVVAGRAPALEHGEFRRLRDYAGRGVLTTANYAARLLGLHSAMPTMTAARLAPHAILLPVDFDAYKHYSRRFKAAVAAIAPKIENRGIDEIYLDLTDLDADSAAIGRALKRAVLDATGLRCSVGIARNKLIAKIASDLDKPDGLTIITPADFTRRIWPLSVSKVNGIGPKATKKLEALGIRTIEALAQAAPDLLQAHFSGRYAKWLRDVAQGVDDRPVVTQSAPKAISHETTFERDLHPRSDRAVLSEALVALCGELGDSLHRKGYRARTIGVKVRFADFRIVTRDMTLDEPIVLAPEILRAARACLVRVTFDRRLRLLGVRAAKLEPANGPQGRRARQLSLAFQEAPRRADP